MNGLVGVVGSFVVSSFPLRINTQRILVLLVKHGSRLASLPRLLNVHCSSVYPNVQEQGHLTAVDISGHRKGQAATSNVLDRSRLPNRRESSFEKGRQFNAKSIEYRLDGVRVSITNMHIICCTSLAPIGLGQYHDSCARKYRKHDFVK